ncbi:MULTISPECIES: DUF4189 domain-containing protein [Mycobacterium]|uniref:DUF4189 domain-containing protein n=2 Tax=Mycobacteriaceae TaxID=1762 RepID=A0ABP8RD67_9MYCO|nr:DUF4189 domain-containing protein [Mycobacterium avium]ASX03491.1 DUF4189 domain-containing protein [Mycobacterium intracellulare subsp. chimaera]BAN91868.1 hypothetical protein MAH_p36 [Mycobacterium avium subsp. hominissuis TH135]PBA61275.1 DUF4189 domain-containing protein [Mycobacterium intracellulare subsp. chimaera]PBJ31954.1 DUF4189 domain-containing protein [Mycobacterium avium subsp. hominissuis]PBJ66028.1 DUF4189 domain-containing protein [Mycobacterium avium subsp. hominissuis]
MMLKRRHRIGLAVATVGATAGLMITALPFIPGVGANTLKSETAVMPEGPVPPVIRYGAMAYAPSGAWGRTRGYGTRERAVQVALDQCGVKECKLIVSFQRCGAVAYDGTTYLGGKGVTRSTAEEDAIKTLGGGRIVNWACN